MQDSGTARAERLPDSTAQALWRAESGAFSYLRLRVSGGEAERLLGRGAVRITCAPTPDCIGVWSVVRGDRGQRDAYVVLRWPHGEAAALPAALLVATVGPGRWEARRLAGGLSQRFAVAGAPSETKPADLVGEFRSGLADALERIAPDEPFVAFAVHRIRSRSAARGAGEALQRRAPNRELLSLMDFYTGRGEIHRTLQTQRALGRPVAALQPSVALRSIPGVEAPKRNYAALVGADSSVAALPQPGRLAGFLPQDTVAVEFASVKDLVQLARLMDERFDEITRALEGQPGTYRLIERYREQLIVEPSRLSEQLGHVAVGAVALVVGDPYLREGTDLSLVLELRQRAVVEGVLGQYLQHARAKFPNIETQSLQIEGNAVTYRGTPDGRIRQYTAMVGEHLFISNSPRRLTQLLRIAGAREPSLLDAEDYRWARRVAPFDANTERAHVFFGDEFVAKITGPRSKILESRRVLAANELRAVDHAALLHALMEGRPAKDTTELVNAGWLTKTDLAHFDGSPIRWSAEVGASSTWGRSSELLPIVDLPLEKVDRQEASRYDEFRRDYERMLRGALDPTSLRIMRTDSDSTLRTELRILPLSPAGELGQTFRDIVRTVGRGSVEPGRATTGIGLTLALSSESPLRALAQDALHTAARHRDLVLGFLGSWVKVGLAEDPLLFDVAVSEGALAEIEPGSAADATRPEARAKVGRAERERVELEDNLQRLPIWAAIQIRSKAMLTAALAALRLELDRSMSGWVTWGEDGVYREVPISRVTLNVHNASPEPVTAFYAVAKDVLLVGLQRRMIERRIDDVLAGNRPKTTPVDSRSTQLLGDWSKDPGSIFSAILSGMLERSALEAHARACAGLSLLALGLGEQAANALDGATAQRYLGYEPQSPNGQGLSIKAGHCVHPIYGSELEPSIPSARDTAVPLHRAIERLRRARFGLGIVPRGNEQELFGTAEVAFD